MSPPARCRGRALAAATAAPAAHAATTPDPLATGPYSVTKIEYDAGTTLINLPDSIGGTEAIPMRGSITYSPDVDQSKIVVFVHGRHGVCIGTPSPDKYICGDADTNGTPTQTDIRSYEGYDYMAKNLATTATP